MIAALLTLQLLATASTTRGPSPSSFVVRNATRSVTVPLVGTPGGPMLRLEALNPIIAVVTTRSANGKFVATVGGTDIELEPGVAVVMVAGEARQLASAPTIRGGQLLVPLQVVSELVPQFVANVHWDADEGALVMFSMVERRPPSDRSVADRASGNAMPRAPAGRRDAPVRDARTHVRRTVIVDAGHGGPDNGMTGPIHGGPKIYEKDITLSVSKRLGEALRDRGVDVVYTRTTDTLIALSDRGRIANRASGDLFISIHVNAANPTWKDPGAARGFETYFLAEAKTEDARRVEQMENEAVRFEDGPAHIDKNDPLGYILSDMVQNEHLRESSDLADLIQQGLGRMHPGPSRGVKQAGFRVLVTAYMPAVLVEIGFGTNAREAEFLSSVEHQDAIAAVIADAAIEYLQRYERRVAGPAQ